MTWVTGSQIHPVTACTRSLVARVCAPGSCCVEATLERQTKKWREKLFQMPQYIRNEKMSKDFHQEEERSLSCS